MSVKNVRIFSVALALCGLVLASTGCSLLNGTESRSDSAITHPSPLPLATKYLTFIEKGDADGAHRIDHTSVPMNTRGIDNETFLTNSALQSATERIHSLTVTLVSNSGNASAVETTFVLAGKTFESRLQFSWENGRKDWHLIYSLASQFSVYKYTTLYDEAPVAFSLGDVSALLHPQDVGSEYWSALAYPAVYALTVVIDPSTLADKTSGNSRSLLIPPLNYKREDAGFLLSNSAK